MAWNRYTFGLHRDRGMRWYDLFNCNILRNKISFFDTKNLFFSLIFFNIFIIYHTFYFFSFLPIDLCCLFQLLAYSIFFSIQYATQWFLSFFQFFIQFYDLCCMILIRITNLCATKWNHNTKFPQIQKHSQKHEKKHKRIYFTKIYE